MIESAEPEVAVGATAEDVAASGAATEEAAMVYAAADVNAVDVAVLFLSGFFVTKFRPHWKFSNMGLDTKCIFLI